MIPGFTPLIGTKTCGFGVLNADSSQYAAIAIPSSNSSTHKSATFALLLLGMTRWEEQLTDPSYWYFKGSVLSDSDASLKGCLDGWINSYTHPLVRSIEYTDGNSQDGPAQTLTFKVLFGFSRYTEPVIITLDFSQPNSDGDSPLAKCESLGFSENQLNLDIRSKGNVDDIIDIRGSLAMKLDQCGSTIEATFNSFEININRFIVPFGGDFLELPIERCSGNKLRLISKPMKWRELEELVLTNEAANFSLKLADFAPELASLSDIPLEAELLLADAIIISCPNKKPFLEANVSLKIFNKRSGLDSQESGGKNFTVTGKMKWNIDTGAIEDDSVNFNCVEKQTLDLGLMALSIPKQSSLKCTFSTSELSLISGGTANGQIFVPGNLGTEDSEIQKRFVFALKNSPDTSNEPLLKLRPAGISFYAELTTREVRITDTYSMQPISERNGMKSAIELKDSIVCQASFFAMMPVPGFKTADAKVLASLALKHAENSKELTIHAELELDRKTEEPLGELSFDFFEAALDRSTFLLEWNSSEKKWKLDAKADGRLNLKRSLPSFLSGLNKENPLSFTDLSLTEFNGGTVDLNFGKEPSLDILDGLFTARWSAMSFELDAVDDHRLKKICCSKVNFLFNRKEAFNIEVMPGELGFDFSDRNRKEPPKLLLGGEKPLGIKARIGNNVMMVGEAQWIEKEGETGIGISGHIEIEGLPSISALMFIGTGQKNSGEVVPNVCIYAATDFDVQLYPGVYLKSAGLGVGINRCLSAIGLSPSPLKLLDRMCDLDPGRLNSWDFVPEGATYLSLIGTLTIAAVSGDKQSPFVLWMLLCLDSNGVFTAAGKLWLASSVKYTKANFDRPAVVASMVVIPQRRLLQLYGTTRSNPAIQNDPGLAKILNSCSVKFSYIMSPSLMDYFIEDASFTTSLLGANAKIKGDYRFAITAKGALMRAGLVATSDLKRKLSGGACGATFEAELRIAMELAGLIDDRGAVAYARVEADMRANASLWVRVKVWGLSKTFSKSTKLNVSLAGVLAFDHAGDTGFIGSAEASFSLGGFRASVDASLSINEGMVREIESRVVALERQVNRIRQKAMAPSATQISDNKDWQIRWQKKDSILNVVVVPTGIGEWYGSLSPDISFDRGVWKGIERIEVCCGGETAIWKVAEYASVLTEGPSPDGKTPTLFDQLMLAACDQDTPQGDVQHSSHWLDAFLIQDPRLQEGMRHWWREEDQLRLLAGVHPIDTRPIEEVEAAGLADSDFEDVVQFEMYSRRSRRIGRHGFNRINIEEQHRQIARGWVVQHLLDGLNDDATTEQTTFPVAMRIKLPNSTTSDSTEIPKRATIKISYTDRERNPLEFVSDLDSSLDLCGLETCTPRQRTVLSVDPADPGKLIGYQQVQLPVRFAQPNNGSEKTAEVAIGEFLRGIRGLRLLRRLPGELEPSVIAEEIQIPFRWMSVPSASSDDTSSEANKFLILLPSIYEDRYLFDKFPVDGTTPLTFNPQFKSSSPVIEYFLEPVPVSAAHSPIRRLSFPPIPLQPIEPEPPLHNLIVVIPLSSQEFGDSHGSSDVRSITELPAIQLARATRKQADDSGDEVLSYEIIDFQDNDLNLREGFRLELWAQELPNVNSGYYGHSNDQGDDFTPKTVNDIAIKSPKQSTEFKILVGTYSPGNCKLIYKSEGNEKIFHQHYRYRFFLRRAESFPKTELRSNGSNPTWYGGLLTPVAFAFTRSYKNLLIESSDLRFFPWFEVPQFNQKQLLPASFDVHLDPAKDRNTLFIQVGGQHQLGGDPGQGDYRPALAAVEILIRDQDEPHRCVRLERELLSQSDFLIDERDFRNASLWESVTNLPKIMADTSPSSAGEDLYDEKKNDERKDLEERLKELKCTTWREAFGKLRSLYSSIYRYQQTSTFVNSNGLGWEQLSLAVRLLMVGVDIQVNQDRLADLEKLKSQWEDLLDLMNKVESVDGSALSDTNLDEWLAKLKLVSILRHRVEISQEIFGSEDDVVIEKSSEMDGRNDVLPLQSALEEALKSIKTINDDFCNNIKSLIVSDDDGLSSWWSFDWLYSNEELKLKVLDDKEDVVPCLPHLTCLATLIRDLKNYLRQSKGWRLVKRPHNTVQSFSDGDGKRVPVSTPASQLLPARRVDDTPSNAYGLPPIFLANILERLGFAVDLAAYDSLGQPIPGAELYLEIANYVNKWQIDSSSRCVVWLPVENRGDAGLTFTMSEDAEDLQSHPKSYGFLKLGVVPVAIGNADTLATLAKKRKVDDIDLNGTCENLSKYIRSQVTGLHPNQKILLIPVRPRGEQSQTLCLHSGIARCFWTESDLMRHRYAVSVRGISRYALLERWVKGDCNESSTTSIEANTLIKELTSERRFIITPGTDQTPLPLLAPTVYSRSDPHRIIFSYSLPAQGQRSLLNHLSAIRGGWHGVETQWLWRNPWIKDTTKPSYDSFTEYLEKAESIAASEIDDPGTQTNLYTASLAVAARSESLFRSERFMIAHYLPYCFEYDLRMRTHYEATSGPWSKTRTPWIRRLPRILPPIQKAVKNGDNQILFRLFCPSDLMTEDERRVLQRFKSESMQDDSQLWIGEIPDPEIVYRLYLKEAFSSDPRSSLYHLLDTVTVPFAQGIPQPPAEACKYSSGSSLAYRVYQRRGSSTHYFLGISQECLLGNADSRPERPNDSPTVIVRSQYKGISKQLDSL